MSSQQEPGATPETESATTSEAVPSAPSEAVPAPPEAAVPPAPPEAAPPAPPDAVPSAPSQAAPPAPPEAAVPAPPDAVPSAPSQAAPPAPPDAVPSAPPEAATPAPSEAATSLESEWGRVAEDGTVFVKTADGERSVGQYPSGDPAEALKFFTDRYDALAFEVELLETRIKTGALSPDEAVASVKTVTAQLQDAHAVGDLASLVGRLGALSSVIGEQREVRKAERAQKVAEAKVAKEGIVAEAEKLADSSDWRNGANRLRVLLDEWKALPRLDRASDDSLWRRFSSARTAYTRRRKSHFSEQHEKRDAARVIKERLADEAEKLSDSTDWGATAGLFRDLMRDWKAAGPAPRDVDEALWKRFRGAQDTFFEARVATNAELDREFVANAEAKEQLLLEAEKLVPVTDLDAAKRAFRDIADKWDAAGKVPRDRMKDLEGRIRKVEQAIRGVEDDQWKKSDPEKSARAEDMVAKLQKAIDDLQVDLEKARESGNTKKVGELEENLKSRRTFLEMAKRASEEFSG